MNIREKEFVFYRSLNGDFSIYKIDSVIAKEEYKITQINSNGSLTPKSKTFSTTLRNKSGDIRLFQIWLQPGDRVKMKDILSGGIYGTVERYLVDPKANKEYVNIIEVVSTDNKQHLYTFEQASKHLEIM